MSNKPTKFRKSSNVPKIYSTNSSTCSEFKTLDTESEKEIKSKYSDNDIRSIITNDINDKYANGIMGDIDVIVMKKNGYINATKLCENSGKDFKNWTETKKAKKLIRELSSSTGISVELLAITITGGKLTEIRGTYVHPKLIIQIAAWCSAEYALKVSDIVIEYHAKEAIEQKEKLLKKKDDKIDKLSKKIDEQKKEIKKLLEQGNEVLGYAKDTNRKINHVVNERVPYSDKPERRLHKKAIN
ncbi:KilA N family protein [Acanthamoeba polyphaga mimivirus]|nr:KilA N family protein [Acanthamoeba polyphaga mimivirus]